MIQSIRELTTYRELIYMMTLRDIRIKYKQSVMGFMWAILMPLIVISAGILVRLAISKLSGAPFTLSQVLSVSVKSIPWAFFVSSLRFSTTCLTGNMNLVAKIYFPREIFPISTVLSQLFDFAVASSVLIIILIAAQIGFSIHFLWVPILLALLIVLTTGLSVLLSAANLFFRDVKYIVETILTFAIFFTPVFYDAQLMGRWKSVLLLNPMAPILEALNDCLVYQKMPQVNWLIYCASISLGLIALSYALFKKLEPTFAEYI
jgi:ABC-type polysaccharide/polyol phosphate export permease